MLTLLQKRSAQAIVSVFENGTARLGCGALTHVRGDTGGLSYGRFQATLNSGGLFRLIQDYCSVPEAHCRDALQDYLGRLRQKDPALNTDMLLRQHLIEAGSDPVMRQVQQSFFDRQYWNPAESQAQRLSLEEPLSVCVVFDSHVHGSWSPLRKQVDSSLGDPARAGARDWTLAYLRTRRTWLANHRNTALHPTVYRMDSLLGLANDGNWALDLPLRVHGVLIDAQGILDDDEKGNRHGERSA